MRANMYYGAIALVLFLCSTQVSGFLLIAQPLVLARMDPIIQPGAVSQHTHAVVGGSAFQPTYDFETFAGAKCTTMDVSPDKSNYWSPAVFGRNPNGTFEPLTIHEIRIYYLKQGNGNITAFPDGLKIVAGNAMSIDKTGNDYDGSMYATFDCQQGQSGPEDGVSIRGFPPYVCADFLRASISFPNCWDGQNLDSSDHHAHMAYGANGGGGTCPSSHPVRFPQIVAEFGYDSSSYPADGLILSNGDATGYSLHADFAMGWNRNILQAALNDPTCQSRENLYGSGQQCASLTPYTNSGACTLAGNIPQEAVGILGPLAQLPGCNNVWSSGSRPACVSPNSVDIGAPSGFVSWSGVQLPVWTGAGT